MENLKYIIEPLLEWYQLNKRDLPWRRTKDPYCIWVSEIMLQQTRVEAVKPYYARFLQTLPTVKDLAEADEEIILKLWEGLGYYSRVRNMQKAAIQVMEEYDGHFPVDYSKLLKLKGIGPYTAGAIGSIAFQLPVPAVDGNVLRVMSRITADSSDISLQKTKKDWEERITEIIPKDFPGELNQALMELGATVCLPNGAPKCDICPVRKHCEAYRRNATQLYPVKAEKKARTIEQLNVFFCVENGKIALHKRPEKGLLSGLWELPNADRDRSIPDFLQEIGILQAEIIPMKNQKHIFTHIEWHMDCYYIKVKEKTDSDVIWITEDEATENYALPSAFRKTWTEGLRKIHTEK
ncbi:MAG: A/G-specific adenine glycosylase [Anaerotignum sp.]|nr:A/G-specific adenine glycosylase [Anaerotignum sp.]